VSLISIGSGLFFNPVNGNVQYQARIKRPSFSYYDSFNVQVPSTTANPSVVLIGGEYRFNTETAYAGFKTVGRNGIDVGAVAVSTIYPHFDLIISAQNPLTGPTGFEYWSYIGAFATQVSAATIIPFVSSNGRFQCCSDFVSQTINNSGGASTLSFDPRNPVGAKFSIGILLATVMASGSQVVIKGSSLGDTLSTYIQTVTIENDWWTVVPILTYNQMWLYKGAAGNAYWRHMGWIEDPTEYP
jgi:hypothetical protein